MCGIAGYLHKSGISAHTGAVLLPMLQALAPRGPDGTGVAIFGPHEEDAIILRIKAGEDFLDADLAQQIENLLRSHGVLLEARTEGPYLRILVVDETDLPSLTEAIALLGGELVSAGRHLEIVKGTGSPLELDTDYGFSGWSGTHGLGHTRMSTESKIDLSHSQPFWAKGQPDLAIVHNGHITNYHKLRRLYEEKGVRFYTENDSEVIGVYLQEQLQLGASFEDALHSSLRDFDGSFCYLAATPDSLAFVKDPFGFKPLVVAETDDFVAIATEEVALRAALPGTFSAKEPAARSLYLWNVAQPVAG